MKIQVLASVMNQTMSIADKMNINTDAIIINQCFEFGYQEEERKNRKIQMYSFHEKGVGLSRNTALMRASGDILLFADDDLKYTDTYEQDILSEFEKHPDAGMIFFNVPSLNKKRPSYMIKKFCRVHWFNCLRYGAVRIAVKRLEVQSRDISFSLFFGGGACYGSGEDTLFIKDCLKGNIKIYASPCVIGHVEQADSTWFKGYNKKFFFDKGALFYRISTKFCILYCLQYCIRKYSHYRSEISFFNALKSMIKGSKTMHKKYLGEES